MVVTTLGQKGGLLWLLVGRGQGYCLISYNAQHPQHSPKQKLTQAKTSIAQTLKTPDLDHFQAFVCILVSDLKNVTGIPAKDLIINGKTCITLILFFKKEIISGYGIQRITSLTQLRRNHSFTQQLPRTYYVISQAQC